MSSYNSTDTRVMRERYIKAVTDVLNAAPADKAYARDRLLVETDMIWRRIHDPANRLDSRHADTVTWQTAESRNAGWPVKFTDIASLGLGLWAGMSLMGHWSRRLWSDLDDQARLQSMVQELIARRRSIVREDSFEEAVATPRKDLESALATFCDAVAREGTESEAAKTAVDDLESRALAFAVVTSVRFPADDIKDKLSRLKFE